MLYRKILRSAGGERVLYWGCLRTTAKRTRLTEATGRVDDAPITNTRFGSSRRYIAYVQTRADRYGGAALYLYCFDLRVGRRASAIPVGGIPLGGWLTRPDGSHTFGVAHVAVSDAGGLAWRTVGRPSSIDAPDAEAIVIHDATGTRTVQVAAIGALKGPSISRQTVTWSTNGVRNTYELQSR
jgi:hypothetical protein